MSNHHFNFAPLQLQLERYPPGQKTRSLQAWDAADELLIKTIWSLDKAQCSPLLIANDQFGALACALHDYQVIQWSDSLLSELATNYNLQANNLAPVLQIPSTAPCPAIGQAIFKIPNNHSFLRYQLRMLKTQLADGATLYAAAKAKDIHPNLLAIFAEEIGAVNASLTEKKCRLITAVNNAALTPASREQFPIIYPVEFPLLDESGEVSSKNLAITNEANVFSREQLDQGARFFLQHLPTLEQGQRAIDLGCGNGVLGLALLLRQPAAHLLFTDESYMAVSSAKHNVSLHCNSAQAEFLVDDSLTQQAEKSADWIICNPPFHQQHAVTDHIAWQMFADARRVLKVGGRLRIVANRHLQYGDKLTRLFGGCIHIASNAKFSVLEAIRRK